MTGWLSLLLVGGVLLVGAGLWLIATSGPPRRSLGERLVATQAKWLADGHEPAERYVGLDVASADRLAASEGVQPVRTLQLPLLATPAMRRARGRLTLLVVGDQVATAYVER